MDGKNSLNIIFTLTELFLCFMSSESFTYGSNQNQRIANTEIKLDSVMRDIAVFRLDILQIWEHLHWLNTSCKINDQSISPAVKVSEIESTEKSDTERRIYSAFKHEKQAVRNILLRLDKNVSNFQDEILTDIRSLNQSHANAKSEFNKKISAVEKKAKDLMSSDSNTKSVLTEQETRIESLEKELNGYKTAFKNQNEELISIKAKLAEMEGLNEKVLNNLYKLSDCPSAWHKYSGSCYFFSTSVSNWTVANETCQKEGAYLVEYNDIGEVNFVMDLVLSIEKPWSKSTFAGFWTGGSDLDKEGDWVWSGSGKKVDTGFINWSRGQPDDYKWREDCMMSCINLEGRWNDGNCRSTQRYVCEKELLL